MACLAPSLFVSCWLAVQGRPHISSTRKALATVLVAAPPTRARVVAHRSGPCRSPPGGLEMRAEGLGSGAPSRGGWSLARSAAQPSVPESGITVAGSWLATVAAAKGTRG
ncbi:hypothetical protein GGI43DRAFT_433552 [Trichoderma evansii]